MLQNESPIKNLYRAEMIFHTVVANLKFFLYSVKVSFITSLKIQTDFTMRQNKPQA